MTQSDSDRLTVVTTVTTEVTTMQATIDDLRSHPSAPSIATQLDSLEASIASLKTLLPTTPLS